MRMAALGPQAVGEISARNRSLVRRWQVMSVSLFNSLLLGRPGVLAKRRTMSPRASLVDAQRHGFQDRLT